MCIVLQYAHLKQQSYRVAANNVKLSVFKNNTILFSDLWPASSLVSGKCAKASYYYLLSAQQ